MSGGIAFTLNGSTVEVPDDGSSLLDALRDHLGTRSAKDGCSPQGQCGCCTVLVDGQARVACVTPVARLRGRAVATFDGLDAGGRIAWTAACTATGASQCGFCTPGILVRLEALRVKGTAADDRAAVDQALLAHLCRCTGWQSIHEAWALVARAAEPAPERDRAAAEQRAALEGGVPQHVGPEVAAGAGGFADDLAPAGALVALRATDGSWVVGEGVADARRRAAKVQGRRTTLGLTWPVEVPVGEWARTLQTTWVEPAYLEPDAVWCAPGGQPVGPAGNGGAFGAKSGPGLGAVARRLSDEHGRPVRVLLTREDVVRLGPKRPPLAAGLRADGTGVIRVVRTPGIAAALASMASGLVVEEVDVAGPPTSAAVRAAGWAEAAVLLSSLRPEGPDIVTSPSGATASASIGPDGTVFVNVRCGRPLDEVVLRSYIVGAAHMALGWARSEGIAVDAEGEPHDLTIRSFGILRAVEMPAVEVTIEPDDSEPVNGSDAVFAAVAAAAWRALGHPVRWPAARP